MCFYFKIIGLSVTDDNRTSLLIIFKQYDENQ